MQNKVWNQKSRSKLEDWNLLAKNFNDLRSQNTGCIKKCTPTLWMLSYENSVNESCSKVGEKT